MEVRNSRLEFQALFNHMAKKHWFILSEDELNQLELVAVKNASTERLHAELKARKQLKRAVKNACEEADVYVGHFRNNTGRSLELEPTAPTAEVAHDTCKFWAQKIAKHLPDDNTQVAVWQRVYANGQIQGWVGFVHAENSADES